jgi:ABC-type histidine transport system ATPase subunit
MQGAVTRAPGRKAAIARIPTVLGETGAKTVADRAFFMDAGQIIEENEPEELFNNPQNERTQLFLSQIPQQ